MLFWVTTTLFLINCNNLLNIVLFSEVIWVLLYTITIITGIINDDLILTTSSFFFLSLASLEFCVGLILTVFFKSFLKSLNLNFNNNFSEKKNLNNLKLKWF